MDVNCRTVYPTIADPLNGKLFGSQSLFQRGREEKKKCFALNPTPFILKYSP
jgi:hypothetical protein